MFKEKKFNKISILGFLFGLGIVISKEINTLKLDFTLFFLKENKSGLLEVFNRPLFRVRKAEEKFQNNKISRIF